MPVSCVLLSLSLSLDKVVVLVDAGRPDPGLDPPCPARPVYPGPSVNGLQRRAKSHF
jgi:hypothetical protein